MIEVTVSGPGATDQEKAVRKRVAEQIHELLVTGGKVCIRYPNPDQIPGKFPANIDVAIHEVTS